MAFGAMLTDVNGVPFYIGGTIPLSMLEKRLINVGGGVEVINLFNGDGSPRYVFVNSNAPHSSRSDTCEALEVAGGVWRLRISGGARQVKVFIFGYQFQTPPAWGIQINDEQGRCILTNETKVLSDVQNIGDSSVDTASGFRLNTTLDGEWAIAPVYTGYFSGVNNSTGQPMPIIAQYASSARYNGAATQVASGYIGNVDGNASNATLTNYRNRITAINVARY